MRSDAHLTQTRRGRAIAGLLAIALVLAACGSSGNDGAATTTGKAGSDSTAAGSGTTAGDATAGREINVAIVGNPQMEDIAKLTPKLFTEKTGIKVNYSILGEGDLREVTTRDVANGGEQFDVMMIGMYEAPQFGAAGWLTDLTPFRASGNRPLTHFRPLLVSPLRFHGRGSKLLGKLDY